MPENSLKRLPLRAITLGLLSLSTAFAATLSIKDSEGSVTVPQNPKRVVVVGEEMLGLTSALGIKVVGLAGGRVGPDDLGPDGTIKPALQKTGWLAHSNLAGVQSVGSWTQPNFEKMLALKPDLIVRLSWAGNPDGPALSKIAPIVSIRSSDPNYWQGTLRTLGQVFGKQAQAEKVIRSTAQAIKVAGAKVSASGVLRKYPRVIVISPFAGGTVYVNNKERVIPVLEQMGFKNGSPTTATDVLGIGTAISTEALLNLPPNVLVVAVPSTEQAGKDFAASAVGQRLTSRMVLYTLPAYSPWSGPQVDQDTARSLGDLIVSRFK